MSLERCIRVIDFEIPLCVDSLYALSRVSRRMNYEVRGKLQRYRRLFIKYAPRLYQRLMRAISDLPLPGAIEIKRYAFEIRTHNQHGVLQVEFPTYTWKFLLYDIGIYTTNIKIVCNLDRDKLCKVYNVNIDANDWYPSGCGYFVKLCLPLSRTPVLVSDMIVFTSCTITNMIIFSGQGYGNTEFTEEFLLEPLCWGEEDPKNIQLVRIARNPNAHIDIQTMDEYKEYYNVLFYVMTDYYDDDYD